MSKGDGMTYAPKGRPAAVCGVGEFRVGVIGLDHGHIVGMCNGLAEAGAQLVSVYDPDPAKRAAFVERFPEVRIAPSAEAILEDPRLQMVASASIPCDRGGLAVRALQAGKHFFSDKPPVHTLAELERVRRAVTDTRRRLAVYYSERIHSEAGVRAGRLIRDGAIGRVLQVVGLGPHRLNASARPPWFWDRANYGGILADLGCHQIEQFLHFCGSEQARLLHSKAANYHHPEHPEFDDFADATFLADNGATLYLRVDWFTPDGLRAWGDGRTFVLGTEGSLELRKYLDVAREAEGDHIYLVDARGEHHLRVHGQEGFPFFGQLIRDCLDGTDLSMPQQRVFHVIELALQAQTAALRIS